MKQKRVVLALSIFTLIFAPWIQKTVLAESVTRGTAIGAGVHYNRSLGNIDDTDFDDEYLSYTAGAKFELNDFWRLETVLEYYPEQEDISYVLSPRLSVLYGRSLYTGIGITRSYIELESGESDWADETYLFQAGVEFPFGNSNAINIDAFYKLDSLSDVPDIISDFDSDFLTFGVALYHYF